MAEPKPISELLDPGWAAALEPVSSQIAKMGEFLRAESASGRGYLPAGANVLRAFTFPFDEVRVLVVGQDPYPNPGHPIGLAFAVSRSVRPLPASLRNIYKELHDDLGITPAPHGDLTAWAQRGVLLLNRVLTVQPHNSGAHRGKGWEAITEQAIKALVARGTPLVGILWGRDAKSLEPTLMPFPSICSAHPSPLSASGGFFGSKPFSRANSLLVQQGAAPIDWELPT
ncbi:MAG: uracil-DNA glycosylase [Microbacteriaceae bacterium]|nr:uracil-DNA glycosylase [Cryobacterium sp.]MCC6375770.1 uracil-DNA glycosylase [Microbacteriaceae bacterium]